MNNKMNIQSDGKLKKEGKRIETVGEELKRIAESAGLGVDYLNICVCALECLEETLGTEYNFPIDIEEIVECMGIDIAYQQLNSLERQEVCSHTIAGKIMKKRNLFTQENDTVILIDTNSGGYEQRYALAYELANFLIHKSDERYNSEYRVMPMLFKKKEEMIADIFAIFLLIPLPIFLEEFDRYIGKEGVPVSTARWLEYLSNIAEVPYEEVAIGYQNIRYVSSFFYDKIQGKEPDINLNPGIRDIYERQSNKIVSILQDEDRITKLFN